MSALEWRIISELYRSKNMPATQKLGFNSDFLRGEPEAAQIFDFMRAWYWNPDTQGQLPSLQAIKRQWPSFRLLKSDKTDSGELETLLKECKGLVLDADVRSLVEYFGELVDDDPRTAISIMQSHLSRISYAEQQNAGFSLKEIANDVEAHYHGAATGSIYGIPWPWEMLTADTLGKNLEDFIVLYGRMKSMKCVCEGQRIMMADGSLCPIEEVPERTSVPSYTEESGLVRRAEARRVTSGTKQCVEVITKSGLRLRTSDEHLYMVPGGGYRRVRELEPGDFVATIRNLPPWSARGGLTSEEADILGLLIGDGNYTGSEVQYTTEDEEILSHLKTLSKHFGAEVVDGGRDIEYRITTPKGERNPILGLLRAEGIHGQKSEDKRAPERIFRSSRHAIGVFLARLIDTDGGVPEKTVRWNSSSRLLLEDVQHLLMRFGIRGTIGEVTTNIGTQAYTLNVYSQEQHRLLWTHVGRHMLLSRKREALRRLARLKVKEKRNLDSIPYSDALLAKIYKAKGDRRWPYYLCKSKLFTKKNRMSRKLLKELAEFYDSDELRKEADTDIIWEQIKSIEPIGQVPCYDICIEDGKDPNFVVEGFVVHNTWCLLVNAMQDFFFHKKRVLVWSREMNRQKMSLRCGSILGKVDYQCLKDGSLPEPLYDQAIQAIRMMAAMHDKSMETLAKMKDGTYDGSQRVPDLFIVSGRHAPMTFEGLDAVVRAFDPDIVYLDSMYHLNCDDGKKARSEPERQRALAVCAKQKAIDWAIPIVAAVQGNRDSEKHYGETLGDIGWTDALAQEADLIIRVLYSEGVPPFDDDYEGYWKQIQQNAERKSGERSGRMRLMMSEAAKKRFRRTKSSVPKRVEQKFDRLPKKERKSAELFLMMGGNREGTLDGFSIHCIPGYLWDVSRENVKPSEAQEILEAKEGKQKQSSSSTKKGKGEKKRGKVPRVVDPGDAGDSFSGLS